MTSVAEMRPTRLLPGSVNIAATILLSGARPLGHRADLPNTAGSTDSSGPMFPLKSPDLPRLNRPGDFMLHPCQTSISVRARGFLGDDVVLRALAMLMFRLLLDFGGDPF
jgi:hypothetical protein